MHPRHPGILISFALALTGWHGLAAQYTAPVQQRNQPGPSTQFARPANSPNANRLDLHGDPLPTGALVRMGTLRFRAVRDIYGLAFSPDNKTLAGAGWGNVICLWDV